MGEFVLLVLQTLDKDKVYIIGGLVDHHVLKVTLTVAGEKLELREHLHANLVLSSSSTSAIFVAGKLHHFRHTICSVFPYSININFSIYLQLFSFVLCL